MADEIQRTIYKLEIDDSGYIAGIESLSASTKKLTDNQEAANKKLKENEAILKQQADVVERNRKALEAYAGTDKRVQQQLTDNLRQSKQQYETISGLVANVRKGYEQATKAAQDFASTAARANQLQASTTGGKLPTAPPPGIISPLSGNFNLGQVLSENKEDFDALADSIAKSEDQLSHMGDSKAFEELSHIVTKGKDALHKYNEAVNLTEQSHVSLRTQIRLGKDELVSLENQGKQNSKEYFDLEKKVAKLTDAFGDQQARIKILASDTKLLDFGKGAITAATSAFQTYASVSILAGGHSEELQKKTMQLFAAMQLLQSLEQLSNLTRREGVIAVHLQSASQAVYTAVVGASTGALKAYRIALAASGIGLAVIGIGLLVNAFLKHRDAVAEANKNQKIFNDVQKEVVKNSVAEVTHLELIRSKLVDLSIPQSKRILLAKDYNKTADEGNKIDIKAIDNTDQLTAAIGRQIGLIRARALAKAAENVISSKAETFQLAQLKAQSEFPDALDELFDPVQEVINIRKRGKGDLFDNLKKLGVLKDIIDAKKEFDNAVNLLSGSISVESLFKETPEKETKTKASAAKIENVFVKTLNGLLTRLKDASKTGFQSVDLIQAEFVSKLFDEIANIDELVKKKQLTPEQGDLLVKILEKVIGKESDAAIQDFKNKIADAVEKLTDELNGLRLKSSQDNISLLQDEFQKKAAQINLDEQREILSAREANEQRLADLEDAHSLGLIEEQLYQQAKQRFISAGELESLNIIARFAQARQELSAELFQKSLDAFQDGLNTGLVLRDEELAKQLRASSDKFLAGKITFEQFQKDITAIQKDEEDIRRNIVLSNQRSELAALDTHIAQVVDKTSKEYKALIAQREQLAGSIAKNEAEDAVKDATVDPNKKKNDSLQDYVTNVAALADSVIAFWQKANEAESQALDRSISLQEKRVEAAQRIAARGNATYLKQEEDRLKELQVQKENAARRELAINAALQASQLLVGITGAISHLASGPLGAAQVIAEIAVIFGALATGYGLVKSLQGTQPKLAAGTKRVRRDGHPAGTDTIPAWLNEGEAVIPTHRNRAYHPAISAIYDGTIPAEHLNNFVRNYHRIKTAQQPDYGRIRDAAELSIGHDGKLLTEQNRLIIENNELQRLTLKAMKNMAVSASIDKDGVAIMVNEHIEQLSKDKRL